MFELLCLLLFLSIWTQIHIEFTNLNCGVEYSPVYVYCLFTDSEFTAVFLFFKVFFPFHLGRIGGGFGGLANRKPEEIIFGNIMPVFSSFWIEALVYS